MKRGLLVFLALCAFTAAMVPRIRRGVFFEEQQRSLMPEKNADSAIKVGDKLLCAPSTPCGWSIYNPHFKIIEVNITNTYCECSPGTDCQIHEDDIILKAYVHRCKASQKS